MNRIILMLFSCTFLLSACLDDAKKDEAPLKEEIESSAELLKNYCKSGEFPAATLIENTANPYTRACDLHELKGLDIANAEHVYLCLSQSAKVDTPNQKAAKFNNSAIEELLGQDVFSSNIMATESFAGKTFGALILTQNNKSLIFKQQDALQKLHVKIRTPQAALAWAYISNKLGRGKTDGFNAKALCNASISQNEEGWIIENAETFENCQPREQRNINVKRNGEVSITLNKVSSTAPAFCID